MSQEPTSRRSSKATQVLLAITVFGAAVFLGSVGFLLYMLWAGEGGEVDDGSYLRVTLGGPMSDAPLPPGLFDDPNTQPALPTEIARAIRGAANDARIDGLLLDLEAPSAGWATFTELRDAVVAFTDTGKPCIAYSSFFGTADYYLASACDTIVLAPGGATLVNGLSVEVTYYAGTFEKIGVDPEFEHVGDFKTAVEPYERTGPSEPAQEAYELLVDSIYQDVVAAIAEGRGMAPAKAAEVVDAAPMSPRHAMDLGLIDGIGYWPAVRATAHLSGEEGWIDTLVEAVDEELVEQASDRLTPVQEYVEEQRAELVLTSDRVAVVYAEGPIVSGSGQAGLFGDSALADGEIASWMADIRDDDAIKAVVLRVNSPGGSTLASDNMLWAIERTREVGKPVVVSMADYAASGGYYIACKADWIVAEPTTITGSIGVLGGKFNLAGAYEKIGLGVHHFKRGELAADLSATTAFSDAGREVFRRYMVDFYDIFLGHVSDGRELSRDQVHAVAQGRVWTGRQALEHGLVDELGGLDVALAKAAELAELGDDYGLVKLPRQQTFWDLLMEELSAVRSPTLSIELPEPVARVASEIELLDRMLSDTELIAYTPERVTIR